MIKSIIAVCAAAILATACAQTSGNGATAVVDPGSAACTVTATDGKTLVVNSGYQCGDPNKNALGDSSN